MLGAPNRTANTMPIDLSAAIEQHRRGELERAASWYEAALAEDPRRHEALHLLGVVALQQGEARRAAALIGQALAIMPGDAEYHPTLDGAYQALGQPDRTVE